VRLGALCEKGVALAIDYGNFKVGFQFHPEIFYNRPNNRQRLAIDNMFDFMKARNTAVAAAPTREEGVARFLNGIKGDLDRMEQCEVQRGNICPSHGYQFTHDVYDERFMEKRP
jgi:hypothetical protein